MHGIPVHLAMQTHPRHFTTHEVTQPHSFLLNILDPTLHVLYGRHLL